MRPFRLRIVRKGKRNNKEPQGHKNKQDKTRGQAKDNRSIESKRETKGRTKNKGKRIKTRANTPQASNPPNLSRIQSPTSHAKHASNTNPHQTHKPR